MGKKDRRQKVRSRGEGEKLKVKSGSWKVKCRLPKFLILKDEPIVPRPFTAIDYAGGIGVFFICWAVYLHTLTPTIGFHDSGDMVTAAFVLGIPHPTGYPLYCLLGKLWMTILPIGNIAYRMNLASALCASLACMMVYFIVLKLASGQCRVASEKEGNTLTSRISHLVPAIVSALMLAFAVTFWEQAVIAEKYTLNALFATLIIFILLKWQEVMASITRTTNHELRTTKFYLYLFSFTLGLSFTHHMQTIYLVPASIFFILVVWWKHKNSKLLTLNFLLKMLCLFILPLLLYLYLPIRASANPVYNWGAPETLGRFIKHISGQAYKGYFVSDISEIYKNLHHIPHFLIDQFTQYFGWIGLMGILILFFLKRTIFLLFSLISLTNILYSVRYNIRNIEDYYIPLYILFSILISVSILRIEKRLILWRKYFFFFFKIIFFLFPTISFITHYTYNERSNYYFAYDYGKDILHSVDKNAIAFIEGDVRIFPVSYLRYCENRRLDIDIIEKIFLLENWYIEMINKQHNLDLTISDSYQNIDLNNIKRMIINQLMSNKLINRPLFLLDKEIFMDKRVSDIYTVIPKGILYKVVKKGVETEDLLKEMEKKLIISCRNIEDNNMIFKDARRTLVVIIDYIIPYIIRGYIYNSLEMYEKSIAEYKKGLKIEINPKAISYFIPYGNFYDGLFDEFLNKYKMSREEIKTHLGKAYFENGNRYLKKGLYLKTIEEYKKAIEVDSNNITLRINLGTVYVYQNMYSEAINEFKMAIKINPTDIKSYLNLAAVYYKKGLFKKALFQCRKILRLDPNNTFAKQMQKVILKEKEAKVK